MRARLLYVRLCIVFLYLVGVVNSDVYVIRFLLCFAACIAFAFIDSAEQES